MVLEYFLFASLEEAMLIFCNLHFQPIFFSNQLLLTAKNALKMQQNLNYITMKLTPPQRKKGQLCPSYRSS